MVKDSFPAFQPSYFLNSIVTLIFAYVYVHLDGNDDITMAAKRRKRRRKTFIYYTKLKAIFLHNFTLISQIWHSSQFLGAPPNTILKIFYYYILNVNRQISSRVQRFLKLQNRIEINSYLWHFMTRLFLFALFCVPAFGMITTSTSNIYFKDPQRHKQQLKYDNEQHHQQHRRWSKASNTQKYVNDDFVSQTTSGYKPYTWHNAESKRLSSSTYDSINESTDVIEEFAVSRPTVRRHIKYDVSPSHPIHILFPLPKETGRKEVNPFGITIDLARPVVDEGIKEVYARQLVPPNSLEIHFEDSGLSDALGPNVAINHLVDNKLDCIIGYAFVYALAPVARMSPFWRDKDSEGIPVITSVGLTSNLDNRVEYRLMTRISSPYKVVKNAVIALFQRMNWRRCAYIFHDQRYDSNVMSVPYGECYLLMASLQPFLRRLNKLEHNYFMFNEMHYNRERMIDNLKKASLLTNGWFSSVLN